MRILIAALAIATLPHTAFAAPPSYDNNAAKADCSQKWGSKYDMVKYCMDKRRDGYNEYTRVLKLGGETLEPTLQRCQTKWGRQWDMTAYCAKKQIEAIQALGSKAEGIPENIWTQILNQCGQKWQLQWDMIAYCTEKQTAGWRAINN